MRTKPIHGSQKLLRLKKQDGSCIFEIEVVINFEMYSVFMSYGSGLKVLSPRHVVKYMRDKLRSAAAHYDEDLADNRP